MTKKEFLFDHDISSIYYLLIREKEINNAFESNKSKVVEMSGIDFF